MTNEAYAIYNELDRVLTFYYDELLQHRSKGGIYIFEPIDKVGWKKCAKSIEKVVFDESFAEYDGVESTMKWFMDCMKLKEIVGIKNLRTDNVVNMSGMFWNCSSLVSLDLSSFNTEKVHSMGWMFSGCSSLSKLDISSFDTKNVTFMGDMFSYCVSLPKLDLSNFNTEKVGYMSGMFKGDVLLEELNVSSFIIENVKSMNEMFIKCPLPKGVDWIAYDEGFQSTVPVFSSYRCPPTTEQILRASIDNEVLKDTVYKMCTGMQVPINKKYKEDDIIPSYLCVWKAFVESKFDLFYFINDQKYLLIRDEDIRIEVLMSVIALLKLPIGELCYEWMNGFIDFFERDTGLKLSDIWGVDIELSDDRIITNTDILVALYYCTDHQHLWRLIGKGIGGIRCIESLWRIYNGTTCSFLFETMGIQCYYPKDEIMADEFLDYLLDESTNATEAVRKEANRLKTI